MFIIISGLDLVHEAPMFIIKLRLDLVQEIPMFIVRLGLDLVYEVAMFGFKLVLTRPLFEPRRLDLSSHEPYLERSLNHCENP